jgi:hypothetical protein
MGGKPFLKGSPPEPPHSAKANSFLLKRFLPSVNDQPYAVKITGLSAAEIATF